MKNSIAVLGSTGSIGVQAMEVAEHLGIRVAAISCGKNVVLAEKQARQFLPELVAVFDKAAASELRRRLADTNIRVVEGEEGVCEAARIEGVSTVLAAIVGIAALRPVFEALKAGRRVALANKESIVCAGDYLFKIAKEYGSEIIPVDSEHSAIFQCLASGRHEEINQILLTASGGPFFGRDREKLKNVTREDALKHPNWDMGAKITIDSATLMNKGLEFIEAMRLFDVPAEKIKVLVHRESIIHSMVEFCDNSIIAQLGQPDMRVPISYALTYPKRCPADVPGLDFLKCSQLTFFEPDMETFPCLKIGIECGKKGGNAPTVMNAANEVAVQLFLENKIGFLDIPELISKVLLKIPFIEYPSIDDIFETDRTAREAAFSEYVNIRR